MTNPEFFLPPDTLKMNWALMVNHQCDIFMVVYKLFLQIVT